jgi:MurNAc alpha-1-phosphate uridylyltransferase
VSDSNPKQCVILAGGLGSRLGPQALGLPKTLLPVAGRPFADYQLSWLAEQGVREIVYCIGHRGDQIRAYVGDGSRWSLSVVYVDEGPDLRGTGGALRLAYDEGVLADAFAVLYGDSYLQLRLQPVLTAYRAARLPALMTVLRNDGRWDRSNAEFDGTLVTRYSKVEKGTFKWIDYGLTVLDHAVVGRIAQGHTDLADLYSELSRKGLLGGFEVDQRFYEIGSPEGLEELNRLLTARTC